MEYKVNRDTLYKYSFVGFPLVRLATGTGARKRVGMRFALVHFAFPQEVFFSVWSREKVE